MADVEIEKVPEEIGHGLGHKVGPLPVWGWVVIGVVVVAGVAYYVAVVAPQSAAGQSTSALLGSLAGTGVGSPSSSGGGGTVTGGTSTGGLGTTTPVATNASWLEAQVASVSQSLNLPASRVRLYLEGFLAGTPFATNGYNAVVQAALASGAPPQGATLGSVNSSPFSSNSTWLQQVLANLPSGTPASVGNELANWVNGVSTELSVQAQNALTSAESIVGQAPTALSFTTPITPTPTPTPTPGPTFQPVTATEVAAFVQNAIGTPGYSDPTSQLPAWLSAFRRSFSGRFASATDSQLTAIYNTFESGQATYKNNPTAQVNAINSALNPTA